MEEIDYYDYEEVIKHFWDCSIKKDFKNFDFEEALDSIKGEIQRKLAEHGLMGYDAFEEYYTELGLNDKEDLRTFTQETNYIQITTDDLNEAILKYKYERNKETFEDYGSFTELKELYEEIENHSYDDNTKNVILFDKCIHAEHETGQILDITSIEELREEYEKALKV